MPAPGTEMQAIFAVEYATNGGDATKAAIAAGYSEKSAADLGRRTLALAHVQELIMKELMRARTRSGAVGLAALIDLAQSKDTPPTARVSASRALLEHAGVLGSAKEVKATRRETSGATSEHVDYKAVLKAISEAGERSVDEMLQ